MEILQATRERFIQLCSDRKVDRGQHITVRPLSPNEAIGPRAGENFAIKKGKETVIEADFNGAGGQAFTDTPSPWRGTLDELLALDLSDVSSRAVFVAGMNAVMRSLGEARGTMHCLNEDATRCGQELAQELERRFGKSRFGLVGLQPAILQALSERFGADHIRVLDLNPDNIETVTSGVRVENGARELPSLVSWCDVGAATGSSIVNGTMNDITRLFGEAGKPVCFFGNTVAGAAALLGLDRICPFGR